MTRKEKTRSTSQRLLYIFPRLPKYGGKYEAWFSKVLRLKIWYRSRSDFAGQTFKKKARIKREQS